MKAILDDIQAELRAGVYKNEENIRFSLIARVLQALGWDIWNPEEVDTEYSSAPEEDSTRVDLAVFSARNVPAVFIEAKALGKLEGNIERIERQLRDYNRDNTALFSIITDGRRWRFYYSQTGGDFSSKLFKVLDLSEGDTEDLEINLKAFLAKSEIMSGKAKTYAEHYLALTRKQRLMEDVLAEASRMIDSPPFPSKVEAMLQILDGRVTEEDVRQFLQARSRSHEARKLDSEPEPKKQARSPITTQAASADEPGYIATYRAMLKDSGSMPRKILAYIQKKREMSMGQVRKACVYELGYKSEKSGSIGASVKVLEKDGYIEVKGKGDSGRLIFVRGWIPGR